MKITRRAEPAVVRVSGRVDFQVTDEFATAIADAAIVDLTDVSWLGSAACAELVWAHQASAGRLRVMLPARSAVENRAVLARLTTVEAAGEAHLPRQLYRAMATSLDRTAVGVG